jgi:hypothetical protein
MSNLFWDFATSPASLGVIAAIFAAAFVVSHIPRLVTWFWPQAKAYAKAAALVQTLAAAALCFLIGFRVSDQRAELVRLQIDYRWSENQLEQQKASADDAERIAKEKAAEADELKGKVADYEAELQARSKADPGSVCALSDDDIGRLRALARGRPKRR